MSLQQKQTGFTLVEMAIVLVILGLLLGGVLAPMSAQKEQQRRNENQQLLNQALEALQGYALVNGQLPCPDSSGDGVADNASCTTNAATAYSGRIPWVTLGLNAQFDPWGEGHPVNYAVNGAFTGYSIGSGFALSAAGSGAGILRVHDRSSSCGSTLNLVADNVPAIVWTGAKTDYTANSDEAENADLDTCYISRSYTSLSGSEFDDQIVWLSPNILFNRMISAGLLP
jgi:prepilin-type N-terminal cleavage/methylation domain-containing protein